MNDDRRRQRLLWRIHRRYQTVRQHVKIGDIELDFLRIADPNRVLDELAEQEDRREKLTGQRKSGDELHLPYWAELWESSLGLGEFLAQRVQSWPFKVQEPRVLDLGCGMGLAGTLAAALGARVLFADLEPEALLFAVVNSWPWRKQVRARRVDWRVDEIQEKFDLILGADVLYERAQWEFLERFWRKHVGGSGRLLLGEPGRQTGEIFVPWIAQRGWGMQQFEQTVAGRRIRIFQLELDG